jgi:hypothetical protein
MFNYEQNKFVLHGIPRQLATGTETKYKSCMSDS